MAGHRLQDGPGARSDAIPFAARCLSRGTQARRVFSGRSIRRPCPRRARHSWLQRARPIARKASAMSKGSSTETKVQRLVDRVRKKAERRTTVKVRTLLSAFGYSRRSEEGVRAIRQQLDAQGIIV